MKLIPLITAVLVTTFLYFLVIEREALISFANAQTSDAADDTASMDADDGAMSTQTTGADNTAMAAAPEPTGEPTAGSESDADDDIIRVAALKSVASEIDSAVVLRGQTQATRQVEVRSQASGIVASDPLRKGTYVKQGQMLCRLTPGTLEATLAEANARLTEARARVPETEARLQEAMARLDEAKINDNAAAKLSQGGFATETRVASAQATVRAAEAAVESAKSGLQSTQAGIEGAAARVASVEKSIEDLTMHAPFDGLLEVDTAEIGSLLQPGALCGTIIQLNPIKVVGFVPELEVQRVEIGALAGARLSGKRDVQGRVTFLSRSADPTTRTFRVEIEIANDDLSIRDGQTAEILISAEGAMAHLLPQSALTLNDDGDLGVRLVAEDSTAQFQKLTLLRDTAAGVWVSGLPDTANVITIGQEYVIDGVHVEASFEPSDQEANQ
jgi:multidrug efflux system membrane fusion protein